MSIYTGKEVAVYSVFHMFGNPDMTIEEQLAITKIYWKHNVLDIKTERELVPFYGNMVGVSCGVKENGVMKECIHISDVPYFLSQDWEWAERLYEDIQRIYKRCKRKNIAFTKDYVKSQVYRADEELCFNEMFNCIKQRPYAKYEKGQFHSTWMQRYRELLMKTMREFGYTEEQINNWVWEGIKSW